jgi:adenine/guanine phosphoribosyltransferase-like PRPP-binding protein
MLHERTQDDLEQLFWGGGKKFSTLYITDSYQENGKNVVIVSDLVVFGV